jgi:hypothetical protein
VSLGEVELAKVVGSLLDNALLHGQSPLKVRVNRAGLIDQTGEPLRASRSRTPVPGLTRSSWPRPDGSSGLRSPAPGPASASDWFLERVLQVC